MVQSTLFRWKYILYLIWKSRSQSLEEERKDTESMFIEVQCKVSTVSDGLGRHVVCWCWSIVFSKVNYQRSRLPGDFRALHAFFCWQALWRCRFHFPAGLGTCPHCQRYQKLVQWRCVTVLDWPANSPDLNPRESRWETPDPTTQMTWRTWASLHPSSATDWSSSCHATLMQ